MQLYVELILGLWLSFGITNVKCGQFTIIKAKSIECKTNPEFIVNTSCNLIAVSWVKSYVNSDCYLVKPISNLILETNLFKKDNTNQFKSYIVAFNISFCRTDPKSRLFPYSNIIADQLRTHTNINHSCPYTGHIFSRQLLIDSDQYPDFPFGEYKMLFRFYEKTIKIGQFQFVVEIFERRKIRIKQKPQANYTIL